MYKRIIYENWLEWVPYLAFGVTALVFFSFLFRAIAMRKERADAMSRLPLDDAPPAAASHPHQS